MKIINIGIIGDYDGRPAHLATDEAINHCARSLGLLANSTWASTEGLDINTDAKLHRFDGLWCAPGSPYKSVNGAVAAIQFAREQDYPFIGTCGGFQHAVIEYARNVLLIKEVQPADFDPYAPNSVITPLTCSLVGQTKSINIASDTRMSKIYGSVKTEEKFSCNFGISQDIKTKLDCSGFKIVGIDDNGEARIIDLDNKNFFVGTLFQPQLSSTAEHPHPLITEYLRKAFAFKMCNSK